MTQTGAVVTLWSREFADSLGENLVADRRSIAEEAAQEMGGVLTGECEVQYEGTVDVDGQEVDLLEHNLVALTYEMVRA